MDAESWQTPNAIENIFSGLGPHGQLFSRSSSLQALSLFLLISTPTNAFNPLTPAGYFHRGARILPRAHCVSSEKVYGFIETFTTDDLMSLCRMANLKVLEPSPNPKGRQTGYRRLLERIFRRGQLPTTEPMKAPAIAEETAVAERSSEEGAAWDMRARESFQVVVKKKEAEWTKAQEDALAVAKRVDAVQKKMADVQPDAVVEHLEAIQNLADSFATTKAAVEAIKI